MRTLSARLFALAFAWSLLFAGTTHTCAAPDHSPHSNWSTLTHQSSVLPAVVDVERHDDCLGCALGRVSLDGLAPTQTAAWDAPAVACPPAVHTRPERTALRAPSLRAPPLAHDC